MPTQDCPGCGCEIDSGLHWQPPAGQAQLCCNKRCALRAQRRYDALLTGRPCRLRPKLPASRPAASAAPTACAGGWGGLCGDVLALLGSHLALRDRLAAALTCRHWRANLTRDVAHVELHICDTLLAQRDSQCTSSGAKSDISADGDGYAAGDGEVGQQEQEQEQEQGQIGACNLVDVSKAVGVVVTAGLLLPQIRSLALIAPRASRQPDLLRRHLLALGRWGSLESLQILWAEAPSAPPPSADASSPPPPPSASPPPPRQSYRHRRRHGLLPRPAPALPPPPTLLTAECLGALGLLTGLRSLSIAARFDPGRTDLGLRHLSSLEQLTSLELLRAPLTAAELKAEFGAMSGPMRHAMLGPDGHPRLPLSRLDGELSALTRLRCLRGDAELLSPPLLAALAAATGLSRLEMESLQLTLLHRADADSFLYNIESVAEGLQGLTSLRVLRISCLTPPDDAPPDCTEALIQLLKGIARLTEEQVQQQQQAQADQSASPRRRRRKPRPAAATALHTAAAAAGAGAAAAGSSPSPTPPASPSVVAVRLEFCDGGAISHVTDMWGGSGPRVAGPWLQLQEELLDGLCSVAGLTHLELPCSQGSAGNIGRLSELTSLSSLDLRLAPACRLYTDPRYLHRLVSGCCQLRRLSLHLPADCLTAPALAALPLAAALRELELTAHPQVRQEPYSRWEVRGRLMGIAGREGIEAGGGGGEGGGVCGEGGARAAAAVVGGVLGPLMFLQELFAALDEVEEVRQALVNEAEWRAQQAAAAAPEAQLQPVQEQAAVAAGEEEAVVQGAQQQQDPAEVANPAADAAAPAAAPAADADAGVEMPCLPHWVLLLVDPDPHEPPGHAAAAAFFAEYAADKDDGAALPLLPPVPLHRLSYEQLRRLRALLLREELLSGPAFRLDDWAPAGLEVIRLRGFAGLQLGAGVTASGASGDGMRRCMAGGGVAPSEARGRRLPQLREVDVVVAGAAEAEASRRALEEWVAEDAGRAPRLATVRITAES